MTLPISSTLPTQLNLLDTEILTTHEDEIDEPNKEDWELSRIRYVRLYIAGLPILLAFHLKQSKKRFVSIT